MATENLDLDLEIILLLVGAVTFSVFLTGELMSNALFSTLIVVLFFLKGMHVKPSKIWNNAHKRRELILTGAISYILLPLIGYGIYSLNSGPLGIASLIVTFSAAAVGPTIVWSSRGRANSETASFLSMVLLVPGLVTAGILMKFIIGIPLRGFVFDAFQYALLPFLLGYYSKDVGIGFMDDLKHHTTKVSVWLIFLVGMIQLQVLISAQGPGLLVDLAYSALVFGMLTFLATFIGYNLAVSMGLMERKSRAIGIVSGSKSFGFALLLASQISGTALVYVFTYYIVRQLVMEGIIALSGEREFFDF